MLKILIAVDGSKSSLNGVQHALMLLRQGLRARLLLAHVQEPPTLYEYVSAVSARDPDLIAQAGRAAVEHLLAPVRALLDAAGVAHETEIGVGDPARTLVEIIERSGCDLAIVGARSQLERRSLMTGSVARQLLHTSPVPVTVVGYAAPPDAASASAAAGRAGDAQGADYGPPSTAGN